MKRKQRLVAPLALLLSLALAACGGETAEGPANAGGSAPTAGDEGDGSDEEDNGGPTSTDTLGPAPITQGTCEELAPIVFDFAVTYPDDFLEHSGEFVLETRYHDARPIVYCVWEPRFTEHGPTQRVAHFGVNYWQGEDSADVVFDAPGWRNAYLVEGVEVIGGRHFYFEGVDDWPYEYHLFCEAWPRNWVRGTEEMAIELCGALKDGLDGLLD